MSGVPHDVSSASRGISAAEGFSSNFLSGGMPVTMSRLNLVSLGPVPRIAGGWTGEIVPKSPAQPTAYRPHVARRRGSCPRLPTDPRSRYTH